MLIRIIPFVLFISISISVKAQQCDCSSELKFLIKKVEENYAGYQHKVKGDEERKYQNLISELTLKANITKYEDCFFILKNYTDFFEDGHLGISSNPAFTKAQKDSLSLLNPFKEVNITDVKSYLNGIGKYKIEGIWKAKNFTVAIIIGNEKNTFNGIVLDTKEKDWKPGDIKFTLQKTADNSYDVTFYNADHFKQYFKTNIYKDVLLPIGNLQLVKTFPNNAEVKYINQENPSLPTLTRLNKDNLLLSLPSFLIDASYLDSLLTVNEKEILSTKNLIIDLRGNSGGNFVYGKLLDYIVDADTLYSGKAKILSSQDNINYHNYFIKYYENAKQTVPKYLSDLIQRMKDNQGKIVDYYPLTNFPVEKVTPFPKKVAILTDKANLSAAEAFLMYAKQSKKVIQIGTYTRGVLDYMNVNGVSLQCPQRYYSLFYPVYFNAELPQKSINNVGYKPDIYSELKGNNLIDFAVKNLK